jgi:hypothetical protein
MRILILALAASALALSGCGKKEATGNTTALDEGASAQDFATNDVTAIDAATGADANMAADVQINYSNDTSEDAGSANSTGLARSRPRRSEASNNSSDTAEPAQPSATPAPPPAETNSN